MLAHQELAKLWIFGGLSVEEAAGHQGLSRTAVYRITFMSALLIAAFAHHSEDS